VPTSIHSGSLIRGRRLRKWRTFPAPRPGSPASPPSPPSLHLRPCRPPSYRPVRHWPGRLTRDGPLTTSSDGQLARPFSTCSTPDRPSGPPHRTPSRYPLFVTSRAAEVRCRQSTPTHCNFRSPRFVNHRYGSVSRGTDLTSDIQDLPESLQQHQVGHRKPEQRDPHKTVGGEKRPVHPGQVVRPDDPVLVSEGDRRQGQTHPP